jgi:hypothetical protein
VESLGLTAPQRNNSETAFNHLFGQNTWGWFTGNPSAGRLFDQLLDEITTVIVPEIVAACDFNRARLVVDIAGGRGALWQRFYGVLRLPEAFCLTDLR